MNNSGEGHTELRFITIRFSAKMLRCWNGSVPRKELVKVPRNAMVAEVERHGSRGGHGWPWVMLMSGCQSA